jgi:hypothetical protein
LSVDDNEDMPPSYIEANPVIAVRRHDPYRLSMHTENRTESDTRSVLIANLAGTESVSSEVSNPSRDVETVRVQRASSPETDQRRSKHKSSTTIPKPSPTRPEREPVRTKKPNRLDREQKNTKHSYSKVQHKEQSSHKSRFTTTTLKHSPQKTEEVSNTVPDDPSALDDGTFEKVGYADAEVVDDGVAEEVGYVDTEVMDEPAAEEADYADAEVLDDGGSGES